MEGSPLGPSAAAHPLPLAGPDDTTLLFESRFESGNLLRAVQTYVKCKLDTVYCSLYCSELLSPQCSMQELIELIVHCVLRAPAHNGLSERWPVVHLQFTVLYCTSVQCTLTCCFHKDSAHSTLVVRTSISFGFTMTSTHKSTRRYFTYAV